MCGIVGVAGVLWKNEEDMFKLMLCLDTIRGFHSTGVLSVTKTSSKPRILKDVGTPWDLMENPQWSTFYNRSHKVLLGHNRWATKGWIDAESAHPFNHGDLYGVHNGTLLTQEHLEGNKMFSVDSENIYYHMSRNGVEDTIPKLEGAYALIWWDDKKEVLSMIKNEERPLWITTSKDKKNIFWASEPWIMEIAAKKSGVFIDAPVKVESNKLFSFIVDKDGVKEAEGSGKQLMGYERKVVTYTGNVHHIYKEKKKRRVVFEVVGEVSSKTSHFKDGYLYTSCVEVGDKVNPKEDLRVYCGLDLVMRKRLSESTCFFEGEVLYSYNENGKAVLCVDRNTIKDVEEFVDDELILTGGTLLTPQEFDDKTKNGCCWCSSHVFEDDADDIAWDEDMKEFLCPSCATQPSVMDYYQQFGLFRTNGNKLSERRVV